MTPSVAGGGEAGTLRHFLTLRDMDGGELRALLERALEVKAGREGGGRPLAGRTLGMIFRKPSTRTRVSFEVGIFQLGGHGVFLSTQESQLGRGETMADTARVLSGYVDAVMIRTFDHAEVEELAHHASIPIINGLTDRTHPCQVLADLLTVREEFGARLESIRVAWLGDGNNVANSWVNAAGLLGFELHLAVPEGHEPDPALVERASRDARVAVGRDPHEAVEGAHVVTTDTWASMGQEAEAAERERVFGPFQVSASLMEAARPDAIFLHCLPAYRGREVTADVMDGPRSRVFEEAENRLHVQKALLLDLME